MPEIKGSKYYTVLTDIGQAKIANSVYSGKKIEFATLKLGDGNDEEYNPTTSQTDLKRTVWQGNVVHVEVDEDNPNWINIYTVIAPSDGGFWIREMGVFDSDGDMIGICNIAPSYKPTLDEGSGKEITMKMTMAVINTSAITLKIDPTIIYAKRKDVISLQTKVNDITAQLNALTQDIININDTATYAKDLNSINSIITKYDGNTLNTPYKQGLTTATIGICLSFINGNTQLAFPYKINLIFMRSDKGDWKKMCPEDLKASNVNLSKITGMTSTNTQDAIKELFQFASNGKSTIAGKVGNVTSNNTFTEIANRIQTDKNTIATNLVNKGVSANGTEILSSLASKISNISIEGMGGKKFATGTLSSLGTKTYIDDLGQSVDLPYATVSGIGFKPSIFLVSTGFITTAYQNGYLNVIMLEKVASSNVQYCKNYELTIAKNSNIIISDDSVTVPLGFYTSEPITWIAIG